MQVDFYFPSMASSVKLLIPQVAQKLYLGTFAGWGTDNGAFHFGLHLGYDF